MTTYLLDTNVMISLIDPSHVHHNRAHAWFVAEGRDDWLSCPLTENGVVRIISHPRYSNSQPPATVIDSLRSLLSLGGHRFIPDHVSLLDESLLTSAALLSSAQVTDSYLLALAANTGAKLATFDVRLVTTAVPKSDGCVVHIP